MCWVIRRYFEATLRHHKCTYDNNATDDCNADERHNSTSDIEWRTHILGHSLLPVKPALCLTTIDCTFRIFLTIILYICGGFAYNRLVLQATGYEQFPHYHFWRKLASNLKVISYINASLH